MRTRAEVADKWTIISPLVDCLREMPSHRVAADEIADVWAVARRVVDSGNQARDTE